VVLVKPDGKGTWVTNAPDTIKIEVRIESHFHTPMAIGKGGGKVGTCVKESPGGKGYEDKAGEKKGVGSVKGSGPD